MKLLRKFLVIFALMVIILPGRVHAQENLRTVLSVDFTISADQYSEKSAGRQILSSLAINNGLSLYQVKIDFQANVFISVQHDSSIGQQTLRAKILNQKVNGNNYFRDFAVDSLLFPASIRGVLLLMQGSKHLISLPVDLMISEPTTILNLPDGFSLPPDSLSAQLTIEHLHYDRQSELKFIRLASLINSYYAYNKILKELIDEYGVVSLDRKQGNIAVFIAWHQISRVNNNIQQYDFAKKLNLKENDPQEFLQNYSTSKRMEKRAETLFRQILKTDEKGNLNDKRKYVETYAQLSIKYLERAHWFQPYIASGFKEVAQIFPTQDEKNKLTEIADFYDVFNRLENASTPQLIYTHFVDLAAKAFDKNQFVASLQLLQNATQIKKWFDEVVVSDAFLMLYYQSLDGVMTSYLRVSINAYRAEKFEMSDKYYNKALTVYQEYGGGVTEVAKDIPVFLHFTEQQIELSQNLLSNAEYGKAYALLNQARNIRNCKSINNDCPQIDAFISLALQGIFEQKLDTVDDWIFQKEYDSALVSLNAAKQFVLSSEGYFEPFPTTEFVPPATILFNTFYSWGENLLTGKQPEKALSFFLKAQEVEKKYLLTQNTRLKILVYNATVPVILSQIEKANFETWANRMKNADSIYWKAKHLQIKYKQESNEELNTAFLALETKMEQRKCVDLKYRISNLNDLIVSRINSGKFDLAEGFLQEADSIINNYPKCLIDNSETKILEIKYAALFEFQNGMKQVKEFENNSKFLAAITQYISLDDYYLKNNLDEFGIEKPSLYNYVESSKKPELTREAIVYFVQRDAYLEAFRYLDLLEKQHVPARETKEFQQIIGNGIGLMERGKTVESQQLESVMDDNWFRDFQQARIAVRDWK